MTKNWQLFKRNLKNNEVTKAYQTWENMTEKEATATLKTHAGTYQPCFDYFVGKV